MNVDLIIVLVYFFITLLTGFLFQKIGQTNISSFFRGGGNMAWWMVGTTIFIVQFSAVTFTAHAARAFSEGINILGIFIGNIAGFVGSYLFFSARYRQTGLDTGGEVVRARFGKVSEQFFIWINIPSTQISAGLWLNGLAIAISAIMGWSIPMTIIAAGALVTVISILSGAWGIVASDFIQGIIIMIVSILLAVVALSRVGGIGNMIAEFPHDFFLGQDMRFPMLIVAGFFLFLLRQNVTINNMMQSYRFLASRDTKSARKGAMLAVILMTVGTSIWFIPAWSAASLYPDAPYVFAETMGARAREAIYVVFVQRVMPVGTLGLLAATLFAASMSSMDSTINANAGLITKSFWAPIVRRNKATPKELLRTGVVISFIMGGIAILVGLFFDSLRDLPLFNLIMQVTILTQMPMQVPLFLGMIIKKTPDWSGWGTTVFGFFISLFVTFILPIRRVVEMMGLDLSRREIQDLDMMYGIVAHLFITGGFFLLTSLFYKEPVGERKKEREVFYKNVSTPVIRDYDIELQKLDVEQRRRVGLLVMLSGLFFMLLVLVPNPIGGRLMFGVVGLIIIGAGFLLQRHKGKDGAGNS